MCKNKVEMRINMKNFKRLTALVLAVLMLISTVACGSSAANDSTTQAASTSAFDVMSQFNEVAQATLLLLPTRQDEQ